MGALLCALWMLQATPPPVVGATAQAFDPLTSHASFTVHTRWLDAMTGQFNLPSGTLDTLPDGRLRVQVSLPAASVIFPGSERTTRWTRSEAFFDVARHPAIRFWSDGFSSAQLREGGTLDGVLELRGVAKPVRFVLVKSACVQPGVACPIHAVGRVSRRAFGMTRMLLLVRDDVEFSFDVRFHTQ